MARFLVNTVSSIALSALAIAAVVGDALEEAGLPREAVQLVDTTDREAVGLMLRGLDGAIDLRRDAWHLRTSFKHVWGLGSGTGVAQATDDDLRAGLGQRGADRGAVR